MIDMTVRHQRTEQVAAVSDGNCVCRDAGHYDSSRDSMWISVICTICVYVICFFFIFHLLLSILPHFNNLTFSIDFYLSFHDPMHSVSCISDYHLLLFSLWL